MRHILFGIGVLFGLGIFLAGWLPFPFFWLYSFAAALLFLALVTRRVIWIFLLIFILGTLFFKISPKLSCASSFSRSHFRKGQVNLAEKFISQLKNRALAAIDKNTKGIPASVLSAMVLGERKSLSPLIAYAMMQSGTVHILVVSGFNVSIVAFVLFLLLKLMHLPRRIRLLLTIGFLIVYCFLTGASAPVVRATVMAIVFLLGFLLKREPDIYNSLALAWLSILAVNPRQLFEAGFQLSFASVLAIVYLYPKLKAQFPLQLLKIKFLRCVLEAGLVSFCAWIGTLGLVAYHFRTFSPVTVLANLFIVPLATLITLCGFSLLFFSLFCPFLSQPFAWTAQTSVAVLIKINAFLVDLPFSHFSW